MSRVHIPNNEGKACDAILRFLERYTGKTRSDMSRPETDKTVPEDRRVDLLLNLGAQKYAIEHTRIGLSKNEIRNNIRFTRRYDYIKKRISDSLPGPAYYVLEIPVDFRLPPDRKQRERELDELVEWIQLSAPYLQEMVARRLKQTGSPDRTVVSLTVTQLKFGCDINLLRVPYATLAGRKPGSFSIWPVHPDDNDTNLLHPERLQQAFADKCPKLHKYKEDDVRTVLILEGADLPLARDVHIGHQLHAIIMARTDVPDEIYLVETDSSLWWLVMPVKRDAVHWPTNMPECPLYLYDEDKHPTAGMPKWYRDALGIDYMDTTFPRGWIPATFKENELDDLMPG